MTSYASKTLSHPRELPREKLKLKGERSLSDAELLAIVLRTGARGINVVELSQQLINEFGSLAQVLEAKESELCRFNGMGPVKFIQISTILEICRRYLKSNLQRGKLFKDSTHVKNYILSELRALDNEVFAALFLNNINEMLSFEILFQGTINATTIHPRVIVKRALELNASQIILAHNHPSGSHEASQSDILLTNQLKKLLNHFDLAVIDHIIVGHKAISMAEMGLC